MKNDYVWHMPAVMDAAYLIAYLLQAHVLLRPICLQLGCVTLAYVC